MVAAHPLHLNCRNMRKYDPALLINCKIKVCAPEMTLVIARLLNEQW